MKVQKVTNDTTNTSKTNGTASKASVANKKIIAIDDDTYAKMRLLQVLLYDKQKIFCKRYTEVINYAIKKALTDFEK